MSAVLNPYLNFKDNCREAMTFYQSVFGGELTTGTFKEMGASTDPAEDDLVMHSELAGDHGIRFFGSDIPPRMGYQPTAGFSMSLSGDDEGVLSDLFTKVTAGGQVMMPLQKAIWGDTFGMGVDKYGVSWLVNISAPAEG